MVAEDPLGLPVACPGIPGNFLLKQMYRRWPKELQNTGSNASRREDVPASSSAERSDTNALSVWRTDWNYSSASWVQWQNSNSQEGDWRTDGPASSQVADHDRRCESPASLNEQQQEDETEVNAVQSEGLGQRIWRTERYKVSEGIFNDIMHRLNCPLPEIDCFADIEMHMNQIDRWWGPGSPWVQDAFTTSWSNKRLWMNPPFSMMSRVTQKLIADQAYVVLICPNWDAQWLHDIMQFVLRRYCYKIGRKVFENTGALYSWDVWALLVDCRRPVNRYTLDQQEDKSRAGWRRFNRQKQW